MSVRAVCDREYWAEVARAAVPVAVVLVVVLVVLVVTL